MHDYDLIGIGVGPGDPGCLALSVMPYLMVADLILAPTTDLDKPGLAETILKTIDKDLEITRVEIKMKQNPEKSYQAIAKKIINHTSCFRRVAFLTLGDPSIYSTFNYIRQACLKMNPNLKVLTIPGIGAFQLLAAKANMPIACHQEPIVIIPATRDIGLVKEFLNRHDFTVVIYKCLLDYATLSEVAATCGRLENAIVGKNLGLENELISTLDDFSDNDLSYLTTVIFPAVT